MKKVVLLILLIFLVGCTVQEPIIEEVPVDEPAEEQVIIDVEEPITEIEEPEVLPIPDETIELGVKGDLVLTDELYEYEEITYEYNSNTFGVGGIDSYKYDGPAPIISADDSFSMRVYDMDDTVDIEFNYDTNYEATGLLSEGDTYVTRDGIKLTVEKILSNKFIFTIEKVSSAEHTELCPDCIKFKSMHEDDGVRFIDALGTTTHLYKGEDYIFRIAELLDDDEVRLRVNTEVLPVLLPGQEYILKDGTAIRFLFSAAHDPPGSDPYGYAAFGFINTHILPNRADCPDCDEFMYLTDREDTVRIGQTEKPIYVEDGKIVFDGKTVRLKEEELVFVTDDLSVMLLGVDRGQYRLGLVLDDVKPFVSCIEMFDGGEIFSKKGEVIFKTGTSEFSRTDACLDSDTIVEYSCVQAPGREYDPEDEDEKGEGGTAKMTYATCDCFNGACRNNPVCEGLDC